MADAKSLRCTCKDKHRSIKQIRNAAFISVAPFLRAVGVIYHLDLLRHSAADWAVAPMGFIPLESKLASQVKLLIPKIQATAANGAESLRCTCKDNHRSIEKIRNAAFISADPFYVRVGL